MKPARLIVRSGLFQPEHYRTEAGVLFGSDLDAILHYLETGASEGLNPNPYFDGKWYAARYLKADVSAQNPLVDYIESSRTVVRSPSEWLDAEWYLRQYPDVASAGLNALFHYLQFGRAEGRAPSAISLLIAQSDLFNLAFYRLQTGEAFISIHDAIRHYLAKGAREGLNPNPYFDSSWYLTRYPDVAEAGRNPLVDFLTEGARKFRNPSESFDIGWYLSWNKDVAAEKLNPLTHFLRSGRKERRSASPFAGDAYVKTRFRHLLSELAPRDGEIQFRCTFDVQPVRTSPKIREVLEGTLAAAGSQGPARPAGGADLPAFPPKPYIARFGAIGVVGGTRLIIPDSETVLSDEIASFKPVEGWAIRPHSFDLGSDGRLNLLLRRRFPSTVERGAHLMHEYASNYFHMISEVLPRLVAADDMGLDPTVPLLIQEGLAPNLRDLLDMLNRNDRPVIELKVGQIYSVGDLYYISDVSSIQDIYERERRPGETLLHRQLIRRVSDTVKAACGWGQGSDTRRRLYVRRGNRYRGLTNEREVEDLLVRMGFEAVLLDNLSIEAQVHLFQQAQVVLAPTGAAVTNILWCRPGTPVYVFAAQHEAMPMDVWTQLGEVADCPVTWVPCRRAYAHDDKFALHDDYTVDINVVRDIAGQYV